MYGRCQIPELQQRPSTVGVAIPGIGAQCCKLPVLTGTFFKPSELSWASLPSPHCYILLRLYNRVTSTQDLPRALASQRDITFQVGSYALPSLGHSLSS